VPGLVQTINVGSVAGDGTGDRGQVPFTKVNTNFALLFAINILNFAGVDPTGATDSTAAFVSAGATGKLIYCPAGVYKVTDSIAITGGGIIGDGAYQTFINTTSTNSNNVFNYTGALAGRFENFQLQTQTGPGQKPGGYGIAVGPATGEVSSMRYWQVVFNNIPNCINSFRASLWSMNACNFFGFTEIGVNIDNQNAGDSGDSAIQQCVWASPGNASAIGITQVSSGGIKIVDNKFNNLSVGYLLNLGNIVGGVSTSDLVINGNSFENCANSAIQLQRQAAATSTFSNVNIGDNQFLVSATNGTGIFSNDSSGFLSVVNITGNVFVVTGTGSAAGVLLNFVTNFMVGDNTMQGSGGSSVGILCGTSSVAGRIGVNQIRGFSLSVNASTGVSITKPDIQRGTVTVTTSSAYGGALFAGTNSVTFATAYDADVAFNITDVIVSPLTTGTGSVAAYVTGASVTGFSVEAISITNGGACVINWEAKGVI
jgi:hypothetical protein